MRAMDLEELSKSQIILLTLLVSFVTSIATGIVTVSLMDQAPPAIAQTVNRIVERTVEKVVSLPSQTAAAVTTEKTVVIKESDLISDAVAKMTPSVVRLYDGVGKDAAFLGLGVVIDPAGSIVVDASTLGAMNEVVARLSDGSEVMAQLSTSTPYAGIAILNAATSTTEGKSTRFSPAIISMVRPVLGQSVVALSGKTIPRVTSGIVTALIPRGETEDAIIDTSVSSDFITGGSPLVSTEGSLIGISTSLSRVSSGQSFVAASTLVGKSAGNSSEKKTE